MCTATWIIEDDGYHLLFNRDESRTRGRGRPPRRVRAGRIDALMPRDSDFGGSWIGVSALGVSLCILNRYQDDAMHEEGGGFSSRGQLLVSLLDLPSVSALRERVEAASPKRYRPFSLAAFEPGRAPVLVTWDGSDLRGDELSARDMPLVSSGWNLPAVEAARRETFAALLRGARDALDPDLLASYHGSHEPERGPCSPCMHREDASTVSMSWITVGPREATFTYVDGPPCGTKVPRPVRLARGRG